MVEGICRLNIDQVSASLLIENDQHNMMIFFFFSCPEGENTTFLWGGTFGSNTTFKK